MDKKQFPSSQFPSSWAIETGNSPIELDHKNRQTYDNRKVNLREVTHSENMKNTSRSRKGGNKLVIKRKK